MKTVHKLTIAGFLVAIDIISARFLFAYIPPGTTLVRISPQFLAHSLCGWILGPWWAVGSAVAGDLLGFITNGAGLSFYPGYTLSAALSGLVYGLLLYKKPANAVLSFFSVSVAILGVSLCVTSIWNSILYVRPWTELVLISLPWRLASIPVYSACLFALQKGLARAGIGKRVL